MKRIIKLESDRRVVTRPWGSFEDICNLQTDKGTHHIKALHVLDGHRLSRQMHTKREEKWIVLRGKIETEIGVLKNKKIQEHKEGDMITVKKGQSHRMLAVGGDAVVLEVSFGEVS